MRGGIIAVFIFSAVISVADAAVVGVTASADKPLVGVGETGTLTVFAELMPGHTGAGNGIFGWDVDVRIADPTIIELLPAMLVLPPGVWTSNAMTSSPGAPMPWGLDAIYDTGEGADDLGLAGQVELFSIQYRGLADGVTTLSVEADMTSGADFVTWLGETGGDYSSASVGITIPEPATMGLLGLGGLLLLRRCRC